MKEKIFNDEHVDKIMGLDEDDIIKKYRLYCLKKPRNKEINFKYGLNILIKPNFDFNLRPVLVRAKKLLQHPDSVQVYNILDEEFFKKNKKAEIFFSDIWFDDDDMLAYLNQVLANDFVFINIPDDTVSEKPIVIDYAIDSQVISNIFVFAGKNSRARIFLNIFSDKNPGKNEKSFYSADCVKIVAEENSMIDFISVQNLDKKSVHIQHRNAICKKDSFVNWYDVSLGSYYTRSLFVSKLEESGAQSTTTVLYMVKGNQLLDVYTASIHKAPHTVSDILTRGVLNDEAKALSRGLVRIEKNAFGSNGYEKQEALLLSEKAEANAIPNLEINNNEVKCSHGSSIGQLDEEKIFYVMSRGLNKEQAQKKIIEGYFTPLLEKVDLSVRNKVEKIILNALE